MIVRVHPAMMSNLTRERGIVSLFISNGYDRLCGY